MARKAFLTGAAQRVTDTTERVRALFVDRPDRVPEPPKRKTFRPSQRPKPEEKPAQAEEV